VDGDGTDEILVQNVQLTIAGLRLFDVIGDHDAIEVVPVIVAGAAGPGGGPKAGASPQFWIGSDGFGADSLRCVEDEPPPGGRGRVLVQISASQAQPDTPDATWHATTTWFDLRSDGSVTVIDRGDTEEPVDGSPSFAQGTDVCGAPLPEMYRTA
jgi:hypothetical protein